MQNVALPEEKDRNFRIQREKSCSESFPEFHFLRRLMLRRVPCVQKQLTSSIHPSASPRNTSFINNLRESDPRIHLWSPCKSVAAKAALPRALIDSSASEREVTHGNTQGRLFAFAAKAIVVAKRYKKLSQPESSASNRSQT